MSRPTTLEDLISLDLRELKHEVDNLRAIKAWALDNLGIDYADGDRVEIVSPKPAAVGGGWECYSEALAIGQSGFASDIHFNAYAKGWYVLVGMDRSWSTHTHGRGHSGPTVRYWNGPADEAPEGYELPGGYPPEGRVKNFAMPVSWVRKAAS